MASNPIEKKPFYHFYPGSYALTAGSWSCNFGCPWCQNWHISKQPPPKSMDYVSPERLVEITQRSHCQGTSISFNEPTLSLEWSLDVFRIARQRGLYNTYVTNGYMTPEALSLLIEAGLEFVYIGNLPGHPTDNTYCPDCHATLIRRMGFDVLDNQLSGGRCPQCGRAIAGVWIKPEHLAT